MYILQRSHAYSWQRQKVCTSTLPTGIRCLGKARLILLARRPDTERMNVRCTPGICARPSLCSFGKCLPPHHCRPIYVLLSDSYTSLACDAKAVWPSTVLYPLWSLSTFGTFTTRVGDFFRQNCRLGVLFLGRLAN